MAGLGARVDTSFSVRSRMNGSATFGGLTVPVWYFTDDATPSESGFMDDRFLPSAHLETIQGEAVELEFRNTSAMPHTIHLHGMDVDQANDGVPQTSQTVPPFGTFTYQFVAPFAGTYHYHCHVDTVIHYERGMLGTVIVRPPSGATSIAWKGGPSFDEEVLWHLGTMDTSWSGLTTSGPGSARHNPDVFLLNGKEAADSQIDPFTRISMVAGQVAYLRIVNSAYQWGRVSLGGQPFQVVASDGRPLRQPQTVTSWDLGPGERYDVLFTPTSPISTSATIDYLDDYTGAVLGSIGTDIEVI